MSYFHAVTGTKLRLRGRGSGHIEVDRCREAPVPLMLALTANQDVATGFMAAVEMVVELLSTVSLWYEVHCCKENLPAPSSRLFSFSEDMSPLCREMLDKYVVKWPHPNGPLITLSGLFSLSGLAEIKSSMDDAPSVMPSDVPSDAAGAGAHSDVAHSEVAGTEAPSIMAGTGVEPTASGKPKGIHTPANTHTVDACLLKLPPPPGDPDLLSAIQCQENLLAAGAAFKTAFTDETTVHFDMSALARAKQAIAQGPAMDKSTAAAALAEAAISYKAALAAQGAVANARLAAFAAKGNLAAQKYRKADVSMMDSLVKPSTTFAYRNRQDMLPEAAQFPAAQHFHGHDTGTGTGAGAMVPEVQHPAIAFMDMAGQYGMGFANQFPYTAAGEHNGACSPYRVGTYGVGAYCVSAWPGNLPSNWPSNWPGTFAAWPCNFAGWPGNVSTRAGSFGTMPCAWPGGWPHDYGHWPSTCGSWPSNSASQLPQTNFNSAEPLPASFSELAGVAPAAAGLPSPHAVPELARMQVPAVTTQEGERFLETIVEEADLAPLCTPPRLAGLPWIPGNWLPEISVPLPEQAGIPAAQGESAGISVQDQNKDLKDELESAVSAFLWPDEHAEMTPPSFLGAAERQMSIPGGINNTQPLAQLS